VGAQLGYLGSTFNQPVKYEARSKYSVRLCPNPERRTSIEHLGRHNLCARNWQLLYREEMLAASALKAVLLHAGGKIRKPGNAAIQQDKNDAAEQCFCVRSTSIAKHPESITFFALALSNPGSVFAKF
jgi:hypothetical protein